MFRRFQIAVGLLSGILLLAPPSAGQVQAGDLSMNLSGILSGGYSAGYGDIVQSNHGINAGGNGTLSGSYYDPNFFSFSLSPYYNQSRNNSSFQSISSATGFDFSSGIFSGSHFPGSVSFSKAYNADGNFGIPGLADYTTHGNSTAFGVTWSELLPDLPTLTATYQHTGNDYSVFGTNDQGNSASQSFGLRSTYLFRGFNLGAYFSDGSSHSTIPQVLEGSELVQTSNADTLNYGASVSHALPLRGSFSANANRSDLNSDFEGYRFNGTIDTLSAAAGFQPTNKLHFGLSATYSDNLAGVLYLASGGAAPIQNPEQASHATDYTGSISYLILPNLQSQAYVDRREQTFLGESFAANAFGGGLSYSRGLLGGNMNASLFVTDNLVDGSDTNTLGFSTTAGYSRRWQDWFFAGSFSYSQNVQTLLITYMSSYYHYSASVRRRVGKSFTWTGSAAFSHSGLTTQAGTRNTSQSYSTGIGYSHWITLNGNYASSNGNGLQIPGGVAPSPLPPVIPPELQILYSGTSYGFGLGTSPISRLTIGGGFSRGYSNTFAGGVGSNNNTQTFNAVIHYRFRKMEVQGGYSRLVQGFSASGLPPAMVSSYYAGVSRWFNFF
ncbi:MAG TPA: hypothetical protein VJQ82_12670 [Terriglobales bacterium]|nr:hypothetical protein [Terriglobales bacterium]